MRLRYKTWAPDFLKKSKWVINNPKKYSKKWNKYFGNDNPINVEIGMGKGKFIDEHSIENPNLNYIGIEKSESILVIPVKNIDEKSNYKKRKNIRFISGDASNLLEYFSNDSVDTFYINFPDPWPKKRHGKRRLIFRSFLEKYYKLLKDGGTIEFKTDQKPLFEFFLEELQEFKKYEQIIVTTDLHGNNEGVITTEYEEKFKGMGNNIFFIKLRK